MDDLEKIILYIGIDESNHGHDNEIFVAVQSCEEKYSFFGKYAKYFRHGLGHGVGKMIHQSPSLAPWNKRKIRKDSVLTIEPGLYFKNKFGIRIEDTIFLGKKKDILTKTTKRLIII